MSQKAFAFLADLAIRQNDPIEALDIYSTNSSSHYSVVNIKVSVFNAVIIRLDKFNLFKTKLAKSE